MLYEGHNDNVSRGVVESANLWGYGKGHPCDQLKREFSMQSVHTLITRLRAEMPPAFTRKVACQLLGGLYSPGTLANLDSSGEGPKGIRAGKAVLYERETFLAWLQKRMSMEVTHG